MFIIIDHDYKHFCSLVLPTTAQLFLPLYNGKGKRLLYENLGSREISMYDHCDHLNGVVQLAFISRRPDCNNCIVLFIV